MSGSLNRVEIIGNLTKDPEVKSFANGGKVCNITIATSKKWKTKEGEQKEAAQFHNIAIFNEGLAGVAERYLKKGSKAYISGELETRSYEKDGDKRYVTEIVLRQYSGDLLLLDSKGASTPSGHDNAKTSGYVLDDEIAFD